MPIPNYTREEISEKVGVALALLQEKDAFLLTNTVNERSLTHKLAEYLQILFAGYNVDCEYNRHGLETKRLPRECSGRHTDRVFPDIVVHVRGNDDNNLLVIEAKPNTMPDACDQTKLELFTLQSGEFRYKYGLAIGFNGIERPRMAWYSNGVRCGGPS